MESLSTSGPNNQAAFSEAHRALSAEGPVEKHVARAQVEATQKDAQALTVAHAQSQFQVQQQAQHFWNLVYLRQIDHAHEERMERQRREARREEQESSARRQRPIDWVKLLTIAVPLILAFIQLARSQPDGGLQGRASKKRR